MNGVQEVKISQLQNLIIEEVYKKFCVTGWPISINDNELADLAQQADTTPDEIDSQVRHMIDVGLMDIGDSFSYRASWAIVDAYERNYPDEKVFTNNELRRLLLSKAYGARTNQSGLLDSDEVYADEQFKGFAHSTIYSNVEFLKNFGYVDAGMQSGMGFWLRLKAHGQAILSNAVLLAETFPTSLGDRVNQQTVSDAVRGWIPRQNRRSEEAYKAELAEYLRHNGFPKTREEEGVSNPDILVDEKVPVELKLNPDRSELNRLSGQLLDMKEEFGCVIACIVQTKGSLDSIERFKLRFKNDTDTVTIVKGNG